MNQLAENALITTKSLHNTLSSDLNDIAQTLIQCDRNIFSFPKNNSFFSSVQKWFALKKNNLNQGRENSEGKKIENWSTV